MIKEHHSAGGILFNQNKVFLILKKSRNEWLLPKGTVEIGESNQDAAKREVIEETGYENIDFISKEPVNITKFSFTDEENNTINKYVTFYLFKLINEENKHTSQMNDEGLDGQWFDIDEAIYKVKHEELKQTLTISKSLIF